MSYQRACVRVRIGRKNAHFDIVYVDGRSSGVSAREQSGAIIPVKREHV